MTHSVMEAWIRNLLAKAQIRRPARPSAMIGRAGVAMVSAAVLWISLACAAAAPAIEQLTKETATSNPGQQWALAQIAKPSATAQRAPVADSTTAASALPTSTPETVVPELEPTATESLPSGEPGESPQITMEIVAEDPQSASSSGAGGEPATNGKYILVSLSEQHLYAYDNGQLIYSFVASTGMGNSTRAGTFQVLDKIPNAYGANWNIWMPNWMGIYWSGTLENGIHALPILPGGGRLWSGYLGAPISYGCVVLGVDESLQLYDWADVGTTVEIRW